MSQVYIIGEQLYSMRLLLYPDVAAMFNVTFHLSLEFWKRKVSYISLQIL